MFVKSSKEFENNSKNLTRVFKIINEIEFYFNKCVQNEYINSELQKFLEREDLLYDFECIMPDFEKSNF